MLRTRSVLVLAVLFVFVSAAASPASAQTRWRQTGTVELTSGEEGATLHTFAAPVPEDLAHKVDDPEAKAVAKRFAGSEQHTATWMLTDPVEVGGSVLVGARLFVIVDARAHGDPDSPGAELHLEFGLDPHTLELLPDADRAVRYRPAHGDRGTAFETSDATVHLERVDQVDDRTLSVSGRVEAVLSPQGGGERLPVEATFQFAEVVGDGALEGLLTETP